MLYWDVAGSPVRQGASGTLEDGAGEMRTEGSKEPFIRKDQAAPKVLKIELYRDVAQFDCADEEVTKCHVRGEVAP